ncbi:HET-domain-containing protein [Lophium mytilinum]|uniref:HET-domain-containing protein n=1 Tax=Lophium mytilinum TaxID=390894 RepID=A0A6A6QQH8_9PEZI|nr:HET-domain-containing protein [Lophium mytilinum]
MVRNEYRYSGITSAPNHIRLLTLLPGLHNDTIRITLTDVDLSLNDDHSVSFPLYECLSYTWGDSTDRTIIYVDGRVITVTKNLGEALKYLRHYEIPRVLWIDALCINQGDMAERSMQVGRMSDIYSRATRVVVWLGPESEDSNLALDTFIDLSNTIDLDLATQTFKPLKYDPENLCDRHTVLPFTTKAQVQAICNLYKRPWFERLWVWQEIRLGNSKSLLVSGHKSMLWRRFYVVSFFLLWKGEFGLGDHYWTVKDRLEIVNAMMNNITQSPMASLSLRTCHSKCSEPRDRVYALMGITTDQVKLKPDYTLPISDVYKDVLLQNLSQLNNLELLTSCSHRPGPRDIPSWAPDWRFPNQRKRFFDLDGAGEPPAHARFHAPNSLLASGAHICTIATVAPLGQTESDDAIIDRLRELAPASLLETPYVAGGTTLDAYCRALFANEFTERYQPAGELLGFQNYADALRHLLPGDAKRDRKSLAHFVKDYRIQTAGRSLVTTAKGYVGLAPQEAEPEDEVVHVLGCRWPLVLRPEAEKGFKVVGHAYVDGANDREAILGPLPEHYSNVALYDAGTAKWWPAYMDGRTREVRIEDPRMGPLPEGWRVRRHAEEKMWIWYVRDDQDIGALEGLKTERKWRSDPRLIVEALKKRGIAIQEWELV